MGWANRVTVARAFLAIAVWILLGTMGPTPDATIVWITFGLYTLAVATDWVDVSSPGASTTSRSSGGSPTPSSTSC